MDNVAKLGKDLNLVSNGGRWKAYYLNILFKYTCLMNYETHFSGGITFIYCSFIFLVLFCVGLEIKSTNLWMVGKHFANTSLALRFMRYSFGIHLSPALNSQNTPG